MGEVVHLEQWFLEQQRLNKDRRQDDTPEKVLARLVEWNAVDLLNSSPPVVWDGYGPAA